jgi:hypothetical protein
MASAPTSSRRAIAATSFDLLNGSYKKAATFRLVALMLVGAVLIGVIGILALWVNRGFEARELDSQLASAKAVAISTERQLTSVSNSGGLTEAAMTAHLSKRAELALGIAAASPSVSSLTLDLATAAPSGTTITQVDLGGEGGAGASSTATSEGEGASEGASSGAPEAQPVSVTITAAVGNYSAVEPWINALSTVEGLQGLKTKWANGSEDGGLVVTTTGQYAPPSANDPSSQRCVLETQLGVTLNAAQPCPATTTGGVS